VALEKFPKNLDIFGKIWELEGKGLDSHRGLRFQLKSKKLDWKGRSKPHPNHASLVENMVKCNQSKNDWSLKGYQIMTDSHRNSSKVDLSRSTII